MCASVPLYRPIFPTFEGRFQICSGLIYRFALCQFLNLILVHGILGFRQKFGVEYFRGVADHFRAQDLLFSFLSLTQREASNSGATSSATRSTAASIADCWIVIRRRTSLPIAWEALTAAIYFLP